MEQEVTTEVVSNEEEGRKAKRRKNGGDFKCDQCAKTFGYRGNLSAHKRRAHGSIKVEMEEYDETAGSSVAETSMDTTASEDEANFEGDMTIEENVTGETPMEGPMENHVEEYETEAKPSYSCEQCPEKTWQTKQGVNYHKKNFHSGEEKPVKVKAEPALTDAENNFLCQKCPELKWHSKTGLRYHEKTKHEGIPAVRAVKSVEKSSEAKDFPCDLCEKSFSLRQTLLRHQRQNHTDFKHDESPLNEVIDSESNGDPKPAKELKEDSKPAKEFVCAYNCGKSYSLKTTLSTHEIKVHNRALKKNFKNKKPQEQPSGSVFGFSSQEEESAEEEAAEASEEKMPEEDFGEEDEEAVPEVIAEEGNVEDMPDDVTEDVDAQISDDAKVEAAEDNLAQLEEESEGRFAELEAIEANLKAISAANEPAKEDRMDGLEALKAKYLSGEEEASEEGGEEEAEAPYHPPPADLGGSFLEDRPFTAEEEATYSANLLHTQEHGVEEELPVLPIVEEEDNKMEEAAANVEEEEVVKVDLTMSDYFTRHPKAIANAPAKALALFSEPMAGLPEGWKVRSLPDPRDAARVVRHFLSPDSRVLKTPQAVLEYLRLGGLAGPEVAAIGAQVLGLSEKKIRALLDK